MPKQIRLASPWAKEMQREALGQAARINFSGAPPE
jgi:hypothetical protein